MEHLSTQRLKRVTSCQSVWKNCTISQCCTGECGPALVTCAQHSVLTSNSDSRPQWFLVGGWTPPSGREDSIISRSMCKKYGKALWMILIPLCQTPCAPNPPEFSKDYWLPKQLSLEYGHLLSRPYGSVQHPEKGLNLLGRKRPL